MYVTALARTAEIAIYVGKRSVATVINPSLGRRLRRLRIARGLSQTELAAPHYTHAYVSSIESGRRSPSPRVLQHFADKLGVDPQELATGQPADLMQKVELAIQQARRVLSTGRIDDARARYEAVLSESRENGLTRQEAKALHGLALCYERAGRWEDAIDGYEAAEPVAEGRFTDVFADIVAGKARCFESLGDRSHAIYLLDRTINDMKRRGLEDPLTLIKLYAPLAYSACEAGYFTKAGEAAAYALFFESRVDDPLTLAITHVNVARSLLEQNEHDAALRSLHRAEELFDQLDLRLELGRAHLAQGITLARSGAEEAIDHLRRSLETFETIGSEVDQAGALVELGRLEHDRGNKVQAQHALERAIELLSRSTDVEELAAAHRALGVVVGNDEVAVAEKHLHEALALYERAGLPLQIALTYRLLGELLEGAGRDASEAFRNAAMALPLDA